MNKSKYKTPAVIRKVSIELESPLLAGSVVDSFNAGGVDTTGQEVVKKNMDDGTSFNHIWE